MFLIDLLLFITFQLLVIYPLGKIFLVFLGIKLWWFQSLIFGISIGIVVLTLFVLTLGYTNNYDLLPLFILIPPILLLFQLRKIHFRQKNIRKILCKSDLVVIFAIILCVLVQSIIVFPNGVRSDGYLRMKGVFTEDGSWHIALINNLKKAIPPENPIYAGEKLINYNYFSDVYIATIQRFTGTDTLTLYFKLIGPFLSFFCASSLYFVFKEFTKNKISSSLGILLVTLSSTYYYFFGIFKPSLNLSPSTFFGNDYVGRMVNYQLSFSYLIISAIIFLLLCCKKINSFKFSVISALLIASGIGFKSYGTILVIMAFYILGFYKSFKKEFGYIKIAFLSSVFTMILIYLFLRNSEATRSVFTFNPFWIIENIFIDPLRLNSPAWEAKRNWYFENSNYLGISYLYLKGIVIFLFTNLGLKCLGFISVFKKQEKRKKEVILLISMVALFGILATLLFTQEGVKWNIVQFIWYSGFSLGILLVLLIANFKERLGLRLTIIIMLVTWISFLPGIYRYSKEYLHNRDNLAVYNFQGTQQAYEAAKFLSSQPEGILLLDSKYLQTPFIVAISEKSAYFADESIMSNLLINWHERNEKVKLFFNPSSSDNLRKNFLKENRIVYIFTGIDSLKLEKYLDNIYSNGEVSIYKTNLN